MSRSTVSTLVGEAEYQTVEATSPVARRTEPIWPSCQGNTFTRLRKATRAPPGTDPATLVNFSPARRFPSVEWVDGAHLSSRALEYRRGLAAGPARRYGLNPDPSDHGQSRIGARRVGSGAGSGSTARRSAVALKAGTLSRWVAWLVYVFAAFAVLTAPFSETTAAAAPLLWFIPVAVVWVLTRGRVERSGDLGSVSI